MHRNAGFTWPRAFAAPAIIILGVLPAVAHSQARECAETYRDQFKEHSSKKELFLLVSAVAKAECNDKDQALKADYSSSTKAIIEGVPTLNSTLFKLGVTNKRQMCKLHSENRLSLGLIEEEEIKVNVDALKQFNECMRLVLGARPLYDGDSSHPGLAVIQVSLKAEAGNQRFVITGSGGFACEATRPGEARSERANGEIVRNLSFTVRCRRRPVVAANGDKTYLDDGAVRIDSPYGYPYTLRVPRDTQLGPSSRSAAQNEIAALRTRAVRAEATVESYRNQIRNTSLAVNRRFYGTGRDGPSGKQYNGPPPETLGPRGIWRKDPVECPDGRAFLVEHTDVGSNTHNYFTFVCETGLSEDLR